MLAFAKDITYRDIQHPEEGNNAKLKQYLDYHRGLNNEKLVYYSLDHAKTYLQKNIEDFKNDSDKLEPYLKQAFPVSSRFADQDTLMLILRKLVNAQNATNNWYRMNEFYFGVMYDVLERFIKIYNRLVREAPEKAREYGINDGVEIDFDDWTRLYFNGLDFLIGQTSHYPHFTFIRRNREIEKFISQETVQGRTREEAAEEAAKEFNLDPSAVKIFLEQELDQKDLELFYTSVSNPIYEYLYDPNSPEGFMDGEPLINHAFFLGFQLKGLSFAEAESVMSEVDQIPKH
jgi:hypothetical protein